MLYGHSRFSRARGKPMQKDTSSTHSPRGGGIFKELAGVNLCARKGICLPAPAGAPCFKLWERLEALDTALQHLWQLGLVPECPSWLPRKALCKA
eukprot:16446282-Heterocapsa_arctica.AAC.3